ncbi:MAG: hypothetical protein FJ189_08185 [Gammaproteobacteria bacterium]|nr:hypothetical protein [Gammaproteobacteria bacterium]
MTGKAFCNGPTASSKTIRCVTARTRPGTVFRAICSTASTKNLRSVCAATGSGAPGIGSSYYEFTLGARWTPLKWVTVRPELRYDWADKANAFDAGKRQDQLMFATDVIVQF